MLKRSENHQLRSGFFEHHRIDSAVKWVEFVRVRMPYLVLRSYCHNIIVWMCIHQVRRRVMIQKTVLCGIMKVFYVALILSAILILTTLLYFILVVSFSVLRKEMWSQIFSQKLVSLECLDKDKL
jgi:hypothetical protein